MTQTKSFQDTIERAKQQRAEVIGGALRSHAVTAAFVAILSIVVTQVAVKGAGSPLPVEAVHTQAAPTTDAG